MSENVNENANVVDDTIIDPGTSKEKGQQSKPKNEFSANNYLNTRLEENETTKKIRFRVVLTKDIDGKFKVDIPVQIHSIMLNDKQQKAKKISHGKFKSFICLNDSHLDEHDSRGCPLCNKMKQLFAEANEVPENNKDARKALCKQAYKFESKTAYIIRGIERGKEDEGIKFWRFNKRDDGSGILDALLNLYKEYKEDGINIFDYYEGHDIILTLSKDPNPTPGAPDKTVTTIMLAPKASKLADTQEQIDAWVNDTKDWRDMYRSKSYDYLNIVADGESPVWDKEQNKFVEWKDIEELKKESANAEKEAAQALKETPKPQSVVINNDEEDGELPF